MSIHSELLKRSAAVLTGNRGTVVYLQKAGAGAKVEKTAINVGPEDTRLVQTQAGPEMKRVRMIEYAVADFGALVPTSDVIFVGDEGWTVNTLQAGEILGIAEVVRDLRAEQQGRRAR